MISAGDDHCPECGRPRGVWRSTAGFGLTYCCRACAEMGMCDCGDAANVKRAPLIQQGVIDMNWDQMAGDWKTFRGKIKERWGKLTDDDLTAIGGKRDQLLGRLQKTYGLQKEAAEKEVQAFCESCQVGK